MAQFVNALIEHGLTLKEILELPEILQASSIHAFKGNWRWTAPHIDEKVLIDLWSKKPDYFIDNPWSEQDLALLEKDEMTIHFFTSKLLTLDNSLTWGAYNKYEGLRKNFNDLSREFYQMCKGVDILIVPDLSDDFINSRCESQLTVEVFRQHANGDKNLAMELY